MIYAPASLPLTFAPPRRLPAVAGPLVGAKPSVLRLTVWVDVFSTGFRGGRGGSSPSMSLPADERVSGRMLTIVSERAPKLGGTRQSAKGRETPTEEVVEVLQAIYKSVTDSTARFPSYR